MHNAIWQNAASVTALGEDIHIWAIELRKDLSCLNILKSWLSEKEQHRTQRIVIPEKSELQVQSKAWLRWLLAQYTDFTPSKITYRYGHLGKPYLKSPSDTIQFNATDSGNTLLIAFNHSNELGLDIEAIPRTVKYSRIAQKKYTPHEQALLSSLPQTHQQPAFLALWTRKEAYGKAVGLGIHYPMNTINLCDSLSNHDFSFKGHDNQDWQLHQFCGDGFVACLVNSIPEKNIKFFRLNIDLLDENLIHE